MDTIETFQVVGCHLTLRIYLDAQARPGEVSEWSHVGMMSSGLEYYIFTSTRYIHRNTTGEMALWGLQLFQSLHLMNLLCYKIYSFFSLQENYVQTCIAFIFALSFFFFFFCIGIVGHILVHPYYVSFYLCLVEANYSTGINC